MLNTFTIVIDVLRLTPPAMHIPMAADLTMFLSLLIMYTAAFALCLYSSFRGLKLIDIMGPAFVVLLSFAAFIDRSFANLLLAGLPTALTAALDIVYLLPSCAPSRFLRCYPFQNIRRTLKRARSVTSEEGPLTVEVDDIDLKRSKSVELERPGQESRRVAPSQYI